MRHGKLLAAASITAMLAGAPAFAADDAISPRSENPDPDTTLTTNDNGSGAAIQSDGAISERSESPNASALSENQLSPNDMVNRTVYNADGEEIGEIVGMAPGGTGGQPKAVVSTSAFLGFGERQVAVPLGEFVRNGGRLQIDKTAAELEALPEYKAEAGGDVRQESE